MNDFVNLEKTIVRELSCRLCLCTDVVKLKPLSAEIKRKIKKLFDITIRSDDALPKAICHDCLQYISSLYLYTIKVEKTQKFLEFHKLKSYEEIRKTQVHPAVTMNPIINNPVINVGAFIAENFTDKNYKKHSIEKSTPPSEANQGDMKQQKLKLLPKKKSPSDTRFMEAMTREEFAKTEKLDKSLLGTSSTNISPTHANETKDPLKKDRTKSPEPLNDTLDPIVLIDGRPAKHGPALDRQITLFYKMECCICHEKGFQFRSLLRHYKDRHGVPGYVTCCEKKFHYFYPKKIIEHMAFHLQPNIFMCPSCHQNFHTSQELTDHQSNGGRSEGKILCPRCSERYPTFHELGWHIITHRTDKMQCDYCGKILKHHHCKKTINHMENVLLCSLCTRTLKNIERQEKDIKDKVNWKGNDTVTLQKYQKFRQAMGLSGDEDVSTE